MSYISDNPYTELSRSEKVTQTCFELDKGVSNVTLINYLIESGESKEEAEIILYEAIPIYQKTKKTKANLEKELANKDIVIGGLTFAIGIILLILKAGYFFIALVIYGIFRLIMGIVKFTRT